MKGSPPRSILGNKRILSPLQFGKKIACIVASPLMSRS
jgi:hypothetical protein